MDCSIGHKDLMGREQWMFSVDIDRASSLDALGKKLGLKRPQVALISLALGQRLLAKLDEIPADLLGKSESNEPTSRPSMPKAAAPPVGLKALQDRIREVNASANGELERLNALLNVELGKVEPPDDEDDPPAPKPKPHKVLSRSLAEHNARKKARPTKQTKAERNMEGVVLAKFLSSFDDGSTSPAESVSDTERPAAAPATSSEPEAAEDDPFAVLDPAPVVGMNPFDA